MSLDFVAIDFETANSEWGSACAVGLTVIRGGRVADSYYTLMNPHCAFSPQCIRIHGIHESDVVDAPTFPEVWGEMYERIGALPLVAHNASFDMAVLERLFALWHVEPVTIRYACTVRLSRTLCPDAPSHRLPAVSAYLRLPRFAHHNAADDARACAYIALELARRTGADSLDELLATAGAAWKSIPTRPKPEKSAARRPYAAARRPDAAPESTACKPFFEGMSFVFTGELSAMARGAAEEAVMRRAGTVLGGVSRKVSVLVVGAQDPTIVRGAQSTKHQRALELRQAGHPIEIIDEAAFLLWLRGGLPDAVRR